MSRSNIRAARILRETESIQLRKQILKAGGSVQKQEGVAHHVLTSSSSYEQRMAILNKFKTKSKQTTKHTSLKFEWFQEFDSLRSSYQKLELDLDSVMRTLLDYSDGDITECLLRILSYQTSAESDRHHLVGGMKLQLQDLKRLIQQCASQKSTTSANDQAVGGTETGESARESSSNSSTGNYHHGESAVLAEIFLQMRNGLTQRQEILQQEFTARNQECVEARKSVQLALRPPVSNSELLRSLLQDAVANQLLRSDRLDDIRDDEDVALFLMEWETKLLALENNFQQSMQELSEEKVRYRESEKASAGSAEGGDGGSSEWGGWKKDHHDIFMKIYRRTQSTEIPRHRLIQLLTAALPEISQDQILSHEDWVRILTVIANKRKDLKIKYDREKEELLLEGQKQLTETLLQRNKLREREAESLRWEESRKEYARLLAQQRSQRELEDEKRLEEAQKEAHNKQVYEETLLRAERQRLEELKQRVEEFHRLKEQAEESRQVEEKRRVEIEAERRRVQIESSKGDVERREQLRLQKEEDRRKKEEEAELSEAKKTELLMKLASQVPYWDNIQNAQSKLSHVTAAAAAQAYVPAEEEGTRGHLPLNGFTDQKVFRDARFRLGLALREAGLHNTEAGRMVILQNTVRPMAPW